MDSPILFLSGIPVSLDVRNDDQIGTVMKLLLIPLLLAASLVCPVALADRLTVGVIDLKPWGYLDERGKPAGQHIDLFERLSLRSGVAFDYNVLPLSRIKEYLKAGTADLTVIFRREEMAAFVEFVGLVMPYNYYLVGKSGVQFDEEKLSNLKRVGFARGEDDVAKKCFTDKYESKANMLAVQNYGNLLKMLNAGRIDAATIPSKGLKAYLDAIGADQSVTGNLLVLCRNEAYLQVSRKSPSLRTGAIEKLRNALQTMRDDGSIEEIAAKYAELRN